MPTPSRRITEALISELRKLPSLTASTAAELDAVRIALARAIASGQDADEIAASLSAHAGWKGLDLSKAPAVAKPGATATTQTMPSPPAPKAATPDANVAQEWIAKAAPIALARKLSYRVAVLDRKPTALGGLEGPAWARAQSPVATYGPITATNPDLQLKTTKWIVIFSFVETVQFVRGTIVLCVLPLSFFDFRTSTQSRLLTGSAWLAAQQFVAAAPSDGFAGITIRSGELTSDLPLTFGSTTVSVPAGATLNLSLVPSPLHAGPANFPAQVTAPGKITVTFPPSGLASISFDACSSTLYGEPLSCTPVIHQPADYNPNLKLLYIPGHSSRPNFKPKHIHGKLLELTGSAPIETAGWGLSVSEATPTTLGTAADSGDFCVVFGAGISCKWKGLERREAEGLGTLIAQNTVLVLFVFSGSAPGVLIEQKFQLWDDQDAGNGRRCQLLARRRAGQLLMYALAGQSEIVEYGAVLDALIDRPVLATGARVPAIFLEGIVALVHNGAGNRLYVYSTTPDPETGPNQPPAAYPLALDNALLDVGVPLAIYIDAKVDATFNAAGGVLLLVFGYLVIELYLPDPYTAGIQYGRGQDNPTSAYGFLLAEMSWLGPGKASLRLEDTAHTHPANPPTTEAGSTAVPPLPIHLPFPILPLKFSGSSDNLSVATNESAALPIKPEAVAHPAPPPVPLPDSAFLLLDLSTRASLLGVEVITGERQNTRYTIDGLSVRGPASLLPLFTLPAIAWEPMYDTAPFDPTSPTDRLLYPPGDGPLTQVRPISATLIPISPLQSLQSLLFAGKGGFTAQFTLPFGLTGALDSTTAEGTILPNLTLVQPIFPAASTPAGTIYTGAWQLSFSAPNPTQPNPVLAGRSYLRTATDNPPYPGLSYGEEVLGRQVSDIFSSRFDASPTAGTTGVPLRRYDLTGYGASSFSEWTNTNTPHPTDVIKAHFHVLVGRTSHEII